MMFLITFGLTRILYMGVVNFKVSYAVMLPMIIYNTDNNTMQWRIRGCWNVFALAFIQILNVYWFIFIVRKAIRVAKSLGDKKKEKVD